MQLPVPSVILQMAMHLVNALAVHTSLSPPNPPVKRHECCTGTPETDTLFECVVQHITFLSKSSVWFFTCSSIIGTLISHEFTTTLCSVSMNSGRVLGSIHPIFVLGTALTLFSAILRLWCYRTLGPLFTFEITIRPKHELITHGPYSYVRHPSYTGVHLTLIGATCVFLAPGTWTAEYGIRNPVGMLLSGLWLLKCAFAFRGMGIRLRAEDDLLRANFGLEWEEYAKLVPYKFIPWVY
ncbi:ICMT-domain-containing protein [Macrolepiota fuliginosa MF-IS2]|uniref:Protein-S-isoprenylcysteine O-methyltransferase n=1 Tax=Macrolepiota fuliginosa MF-IS2 TaxID=1400762 RepID=A0A9P5XFF2_9AGAR|nr:ICMT-domain-containing protein [Macrolepiota fuliginosa MF-IS2]